MDPAAVVPDPARSGAVCTVPVRVLHHVAASRQDRAGFGRYHEQINATCAPSVTGLCLTVR
jgi:hypothetical protein